MKRFLYLITFLVLYLTMPLMGQNSYMQWINGDKHVLGLVKPATPVETLEVKRPGYYRQYLRAYNQIQDTFFFRNLSDQTLIINKIHVQDTTLYTYTRATKPGKIGYIVYHTFLNAHASGIENVVVRFNVMTNFSPWVMCETNYIIIGNYNVSRVEIKTNYNIIYTEIIDSFVSRKLVCDHNDQPRSMGLVHAKTGTKMHTWNYWDALGRSADSIFTKSAFIYVKDDYNCARYQLNIIVKQNGVWQKAIYRTAGNQYQVLVDEFSDSIFLYNDTVYTKLDIRNQKGAETMHFYAVNVIRYSDDFLAFAHNLNGFAYVPAQYAIVFDKDLTIDVAEEAERLKREFPLMTFSVLYDQLLLVTLPKQRYWIDEHYLNRLLKDNKIDYLSQMLHSNEYGFTFLQKTIIIRGIIMENASASDSLLKSHGFSLSKKYPELGWVELEYKDRIIDRDFCASFNALGEAALFEDRVAQWYSFRRKSNDYYDFIKE